MNKYKVTIKVTNICTYETDDASSQADAIAQAFNHRYLWEREWGGVEYTATAEEQEVN